MPKLEAAFGNANTVSDQATICASCCDSISDSFSSRGEVETFKDVAEETLDDLVVFCELCSACFFVHGLLDGHGGNLTCASTKLDHDLCDVDDLVPSLVLCGVLGKDSASYAEDTVQGASGYDFLNVSAAFHACLDALFDLVDSKCDCYIVGNVFC